MRNSRIREALELMKNESHEKLENLIDPGKKFRELSLGQAWNLYRHWFQNFPVLLRSFETSWIVWTESILNWNSWSFAGSSNRYRKTVISIAISEFFGLLHFYIDLIFREKMVNSLKIFGIIFWIKSLVARVSHAGNSGSIPGGITMISRVFRNLLKTFFVFPVSLMSFHFSCWKLRRFMNLEILS